MFQRALVTSAVWLGLSVASASVAQAELGITIHYLKQEVAAPPTLSNLDPIPDDLGQRGAELGLEDNITTGRFLGQSYHTTTTTGTGEFDSKAGRSGGLNQIFQLRARNPKPAQKEMVF